MDALGDAPAEILAHVFSRFPPVLWRKCVRARDLNELLALGIVHVHRRNGALACRRIAAGAKPLVILVDTHSESSLPGRG